jgi:hypothetical protein
MSKLERRRIDSQGYLEGEAQRKNPEKKKNNSGRFIGQRRAGALFPKERRVIALCARLLGSVGALLTQGQGRQVQKIPKMSKIPKIAIQSRQLG